MTIRSLLAAALFTVAGITAFAPNAMACGFIGCIVNGIAPGAGDALDRWNRDSGHPAEQIEDGVLCLLLC